MAAATPIKMTNKEPENERPRLKIAGAIAQHFNWLGPVVFATITIGGGGLLSFANLKARFEDEQADIASVKQSVQALTSRVDVLEKTAARTDEGVQILLSRRP